MSSKKTAPPEPADDAVAESVEKPEPKVGSPEYDWSNHYDTKDLYTHTFPDGKVVAVKSFKSIWNKTWLYKMRDLPTNVDVEFAALERASCPTAREVLSSLDDSNGDPLEDFIDAWMADGTKRDPGDKGLTRGE